MMFSVVLCTFNRGDIIATSVKGVLGQTSDDFELIVVDDGSTDNTPDVLAAVHDPRLRVVSQLNGGLSAARNTGIGAASGRFVVFLDDDDRVSPDWLAGLASVVDESTGYVSCTCHVEKPGEGLERLAFRDGPFGDVRGIFMAGTFAVDRRVLVDVGGFAEAIRVSHQTEMLLRALPEMKRRGLEPALVDEPLVTIVRQPREHRIHSPGDSLHGAEYLIEHHGEELASYPRVLADYHAIAGVSAAQLGENGRARSHFYQAVRTHPRFHRHLFRLGASLLPPLSRRVWPPVGSAQHAEAP